MSSVDSELGAVIPSPREVDDLGSKELEFRLPIHFHCGPCWVRFRTGLVFVAGCPCLESLHVPDRVVDVLTAAMSGVELVDDNAT